MGLACGHCGWTNSTVPSVIHRAHPSRPRNAWIIPVIHRSYYYDGDLFNFLVVSGPEDQQDAKTWGVVPDALRD